MPLDPQVEAMIAQSVAAGAPHSNEVPPAQARENLRKRAEEVNTPVEPVAKIVDMDFPGPAGRIRLRVYTPEGKAPFPGLAYFHGGGWMLGDLDTHQLACSEIANRTPCVVVSVEYRLSPEHRFPAGLEDCYAATEWVAKNGEKLGIDTGRIAVGGDSSGGNLAAAVCLVARDRKGPRIAAQLLVYPVLDYNFDTKSYHDNAEGYLLTRDVMIYFWDAYLEKASDRTNPYAAPLQARDLRGLPPAMMLTGEYDPLRDEGVAYTERLREAGVPVVARDYEGLVHGVWGHGPVIERARGIREEAVAFLRAEFKRAHATAGNAG